MAKASSPAIKCLQLLFIVRRTIGYILEPIVQLASILMSIILINRSSNSIISKNFSGIVNGLTHCSVMDHLPNGIAQMQVGVGDFNWNKVLRWLSIGLRGRGYLIVTIENLVISLVCNRIISDNRVHSTRMPIPRGQFYWIWNDTVSP